MMFKALRELFTGRYEGKPITLLSDEDYIAIAARDGCSACGHPIDTRTAGVAFSAVNDSELGVSVFHLPCPSDVTIGVGA